MSQISTQDRLSPVLKGRRTYPSDRVLPSARFGRPLNSTMHNMTTVVVQISIVRIVSQYGKTTRITGLKVEADMCSVQREVTLVAMWRLPEIQIGETICGYLVDTLVNAADGLSDKSVLTCPV